MKFPSIDFARRIEEFPEHQHDDELCANTSTAVTDIVVQTREYIVHSARASIVRNVITNKQQNAFLVNSNAKCKVIRFL